MMKTYTQQEVDEIKRKSKEDGYDVGVRNKSGENHNVSAPETRERLKALEVNQNNIMQEIQEIKTLITGLTDKVEKALKEKADKTEVDGVVEDVEKLKTWMWKAIGVVSATLFLLSFFKDQILQLFK